MKSSVFKCFSFIRRWLLFLVLNLFLTVLKVFKTVFSESLKIILLRRLINSLKNYWDRCYDHKACPTKYIIYCYNRPFIYVLYRSGRVRWRSSCTLMFISYLMCSTPVRTIGVGWKKFKCGKNPASVC